MVCFLNDMQKHMKSMSVPWWQTVRNNYVCVYLIELQWSSKDSLYSSESIYIILLQEEPKMEELQLHLHGAHEPDH